jgi:hypothetical protein
LEKVEPGAVLGREGEFEAVRGLLCDPGSGLFGDVRGMIVDDQLDRRVGRIGGVDKLEEFDEFAAAMASPYQGPVDPGHAAAGPWQRRIPAATGRMDPPCGAGRLDAPAPQLPMSLLFGSLFVTGAPNRTPGA